MGRATLVPLGPWSLGLQAVLAGLDAEEFPLRIVLDDHERTLVDRERIGDAILLGLTLQVTPSLSCQEIVDPVGKLDPIQCDGSVLGKKERH